VTKYKDMETANEESTRNSAHAISSGKNSLLGSSIKDGNVSGIKAAHDDIELMEKYVKMWRETSGMHTIMDELEERKGKNTNVNDFTLTIANGIEEGTNRAAAAVSESALVSALLLSFSVPLVVNPPDAIAELDNTDWKKIFHLYGWGMMTASGTAVLVYARVYTTAVSRTVRSSDKLRIQLAGNAFNDTLMLVYAMFGCFIVGLTGDTVTYYGILQGIIISTISSLAIFLGAALGTRFITAGHIEYGWRRHRNSREDPVDDYLIFETLQRKMKYGKDLKEGARSIFVWDEDEKKTSFKGIHGSGCDLFDSFKLE